MSESVLALRNIYIKNRGVFLLVLKIFISSGVLMLVLYQINLFEIEQMVRTSNKIIILSAFSLSIVNIYLQYLKWKLVCNTILDEYDKKKILVSLLYGFSAGIFTPARIGEYFGRAISFSGIPLVKVTAATIIDKFFTMAVVAIIGFILFLFYLVPAVGFSGILLLLLIGIFVYLIINSSGPLIINAVIMWFLKFKKISYIYNHLSFIKKLNLKAGLMQTFLSFLFYLCFILQFALLVSAFTNHFALLNYLWVGSLVMFSKTIIPSITFGDFGIREGASVYFIQQFGESAAVGFNASILLFIINVLFPALIGLVFVIKRKC